MAVLARRFAVGVVATRIDSAAKTDWTPGSSVLVTNTGGVVVDLGSAAVAVGAGYELGPGGSVTLDLDEAESLWGIAPAACNVQVLETGI